MSAAGLSQHLAEGASGVARCWKLVRRDGVALGFTDHDAEIAFGGTVYKANTGLTAAALSQTTGLSVDNTEALGALSDAAIREADIAAGRYDGAMVEAWLVCWQEPELRELVFRGTLGEIKREGGAFAAELRGLAEKLNQPTGRVYHKACSCVLGDTKCGVDLESPAFGAEAEIVDVSDGRILSFAGLGGYAARWFENGRIHVITGTAEGLSGVVKNDRTAGATRAIELWSPLAALPEAGDLVRVSAGCDKRMETCRLKFSNILNFRGFPDIPGDDWMIAHPARAWVLNGGSRR